MCSSDLLYWIAGSVVRSIQQVVINKHFDKIDYDELIKKNSKKSQAKMEKLQAQQAKMNAYASMNTRNIQTKANVNTVNNTANQTQKPANAPAAKSGSLMARANLVKEYNEKNNNK